ncbi:MAG: hypothetical protein ASARMPRED_009254 [Alectoria sarmentosa]|nr:MAG: hypothetical protein ASARMPRED_009254 [Alectoria sarmentosa]
MSILSLCRFLVFAQSLRFSVATLPSLDTSSLPQPTVTATPLFELNGNFTLLPSPVISKLRNTSNDIFPPNYLIPNTNPLIILAINPTRHDPVNHHMLTYMIIYALDSLVQDTIQFRGNKPLPEDGMGFNSNNAAIFANSYSPGTRDLTYGTMATLLRGIWEITALFGSHELDMEVYSGRQDEAHYWGHIALSSTAGSDDSE